MKCKKGHKVREHSRGKTGDRQGMTSCTRVIISPGRANQRMDRAGLTELTINSEEEWNLR